MRSPSWSQLSPQEQKVLAPLAPEWDKLEPQSKQKWRGLAQRYPTMAPDEQQRVHQQMQSWAKLSPQERAVAREQYKSIKQLPPEKKAEVRERWQAYQSLPPETKRELAAKPAAAGEPPRAWRRPCHQDASDRHLRRHRNRHPPRQAPALDRIGAPAPIGTAPRRIAATAWRRAVRSAAGDGAGVHDRVRHVAAGVARERPRPPRI